MLTKLGAGTLVLFAVFAAVALARTKLKTVSADELARIAAIADLRVLTELVTSLGQARSAASARAALARSLNH